MWDYPGGVVERCICTDALGDSVLLYILHAAPLVPRKPAGCWWALWRRAAALNPKA